MNAVPGIVYLVGAGPGDPELITVRGLRLLQTADVVVYDRLVARELLAEVKEGAELIDVGKAPGAHRYAQGWINALLIDRAVHGKTVVRLKGGDPYVFGRGHEELTACRHAGVECLDVPGISSAIAAPAAAGIPVTHRGVARSVAIVTGQVASGERAPGLDFAALAAMDTVVILMGRSNLRSLTESLMVAGRDPETPAACIEQGTTGRQRVASSTLRNIAEVADREGLRSPMVTVVGQVAANAIDRGTEETWLEAVNRAAVSRAG